jgi:hypothetical protein
MTSEQFQSIPGENTVKARETVMTNKKKMYLQALVQSDSCNESEPSSSFNNNFSVRNQSKSYKEDIKMDFDRFVKLYCMYIGNNTSTFDERLNNLVQDKKSLMKKSSGKVYNKHLKTELQRRYHYLGVDDREPRYSNFEHTRLMTYLTSEKYTLPKSEISYVKNELSLFLQLHEVYVKNKKMSTSFVQHYLRQIERK